MSQSEDFGVAISSEFHTDSLWKYCTVQGLCTKKDSFLWTTVTLNWRLILVSLLSLTPTSCKCLDERWWMCILYNEIKPFRSFLPTHITQLMPRRMWGREDSTPYLYFLSFCERFLMHFYCKNTWKCMHSITTTAGLISFLCPCCLRCIKVR